MTGSLPFQLAITGWILVALTAASASVGNEPDYPDAQHNTSSPLMLSGDAFPADPARIDFSQLPKVRALHAVISDVRDRDGNWVHQHAYLAHHDGRYWAMWSDGPGQRNAGVPKGGHRNRVPGHDRAGTRISFATSPDGLNWTAPSDLSGPPRREGFGWIARGLWVRDGELLALASHFRAPGYSGEGLSLEAFRWNPSERSWQAIGTVLDNTLNNFPPKRLPNGKYMMTRRDSQRQVSVMIGGVSAFNQWTVSPLASYDGKGRPEEPYWYLLPDGKSIVGLIRDNGRSGKLLRTFSTDNGQSWSEIAKTNFPDATSKFFALRTSRGDYVLVSNANPRRRDPLTIAVSRDGLVYSKLFYLIGGRHIDYPHIIEHDNHLLIAFSGAKQTMEVLKVSLDDLANMKMPERVAISREIAKSITQESPQPHWIDLGDEGKTLLATATLRVPEKGEAATLAFTTSSGQQRVLVGINEQGKLLANLYSSRAMGKVLPAGETLSLSIRIDSHSKKPDRLEVKLAGPEPGAPQWTLINESGRSDANLSQTRIQGGDAITNLKVNVAR